MIPLLAGVGAMLAAFGLMRLRTLDLAQRMDRDFDPDSTLAPHLGSALLIGAGTFCLAFAWALR